MIMTQEEKKLLLQDLCARLPYGVKFNYGGYDGCDYKVELITSIIVNDFPIEDCKPYLRPMSSMTNKEVDELNNLIYNSYEIRTEIEASRLRIDWLNAHHFDYRGLIPKSLAIAVTEENNPYKK